jgi:hypothetical protein
VRVLLTPDTAIVTAGETRQFSASGQLSDSATAAIAVTFTATGGTITPDGLYTAGDTPGTFAVVATADALADTSTVTVVPPPPPPPPTTYATEFDVDENPLSEGGRWQHLDPLLTPVRTLGGRAFGTMEGDGDFDDSNGYLTGYGNDYEVEGTIWINPDLERSGFREVEILLRWTDDGPERDTPFGATHASGYEINVAYDGRYMQLGRFKGDKLVQVDNYAVPQTGDRFRARVEGQRIRVWWNDVLMIDFTDDDAQLRITTGHPGIGFFVRDAPNTDFGFEAIVVRPL